VANVKNEFRLLIRLHGRGRADGKWVSRDSWQ
jgi:hypothetical protein